MEWKGKLYVDTTLPFGPLSLEQMLGSGCSSSMVWRAALPRGLPPDTTEGQRALQRALDIILCEVGDPMQSPLTKLEGPVLITVFLGIELDTKALTKVGTVEEGDLPGERERRSGTKRELLSLIGQL